MKSSTLFSSSSPCSILYLLTVLSLCFSCCLSEETSNQVLCIRTERSALLRFKSDLIDDSNRLASWNNHNPDCCKWSGVICNNVTGHVQELHLGGPNDSLHGHCHGPYDTDEELEAASKQMLQGSINRALTTLKELHYLDLSCNDFGQMPIPSFIGELKNLRYLNLSTSNIDGQIPPQLGNLTMLRVLDLRFGLWGSQFPVKSLHWLANLHELQKLDLTGYDLSNERKWMQVMAQFPLLQLRLPSCSLSRIPRRLNTANLTSLSVLDLSYNSFDSSLMPGWIFNLSRLVSVDLTNCNFHNLVPGVEPGFQKLSSLRTLSVSGNNVMNHSSVLKGVFTLGNLVSLDMSTCGFTNPILHDLQNMSSLVSLDLSNRIVEKLPNSLVNLCNMKSIDLQSNLLFGSVTELLQNLCECKSSKLETC